MARFKKELEGMMRIYIKDKSTFWYDLVSEDEYGRTNNVVIEFDDILSALKQYAKEVCKSRAKWENNMMDITNEISKEVFE